MKPLALSTLMSVLLTLCVEVAFISPAAGKTLEGVQEIKFKSTHLDTEETFWVLTPPGYDDAANVDKKYPVVWFVQGRPGNLEPYRELMKKKIFEPCLVVASDVDGGEAAWSDVDRPTESYFIKEVVPYVREHFRMRDGPGSICGQSKGGSGAVRLALRYPELFGSVVSYDGALGLYDSKRPYEALKEQFKDLAAKNHDAIQNMPVLLIGGGWFHNAAKEYLPRFQEMGLDVRYIELQEAGHSGGLMTELLGAEVATTHMNGWIEPTLPTPVIQAEATQSIEPVKVTIDIPGKLVAATIRYTTDGTYPTHESPAYTGPITLEESAVVRARAFTEQWVDFHSGFAVERITIHKLHPAASGTKDLQRGLAATVYGDQERLELPEGAKPTSRGTVENTSREVPAEADAKKAVHRWAGFLIVPETGIYTIDLRAKMGDARLFLDGENLGLYHSAVVRHHVALEKGPHPIRIDYHHSRADRAGNVWLKWAPVGQDPHDIPADAFQHDGE